MLDEDEDDVRSTAGDEDMLAEPSPGNTAMEADIETVTGDSMDQDLPDNFLHLYLDKFGDTWLNEMERDSFHANLGESDSGDDPGDTVASPETKRSNLRFIDIRVLVNLSLCVR